QVHVHVGEQDDALDRTAALGARLAAAALAARATDRDVRRQVDVEAGGRHLDRVWLALEILQFDDIVRVDQTVFVVDVDGAGVDDDLDVVVLAQGAAVIADEDRLVLTAAQFGGHDAALAHVEHAADRLVEEEGGRRPADGVDLRIAAADRFAEQGQADRRQ